MTVAFERLAESVILVERDEQVASVWQTIINTPDGAEWLAKEIINFKLTPESAKRLIASSPKAARELAFKTIVQNRVSHGGILAEGAGLIKSGENGKGSVSRWYPSTLRRRILDISKVRDRIKFVKGDGFKVIEKYSNELNAIYFIDPPYTASKKKAGTRLYKYHQVNHEKLFELMSKVKGDFLMTYDNADEACALALKYRFGTRLVAMNNQYFTKVERIPENRGAGPSAPAPLFSGFSWSFRDLLTMTELLIGRNLNWMDK